MNNFEQSLKELENIISMLESKDVTLEESISLFEKGVYLSKICKQTLDNAEQKIITLTQAESFTDIVDFTYYDGNEFVILAQKADGSLIATTNNIYNPEYVSQPE